MFTTAGIFNPQGEPFSECKERLIAKAAALAEDVKKIESSAASKDNLILAAEAAAKIGRELAEEMKATSASLGSDLQEAQVSLLGSTKVVTTSLSDLISQ